MKTYLFIKTSSLLLIAASLDLGTRLVTELTVYMPISRARLCGRGTVVRGVVMTRARKTSAHYPGYVYYYTTAPLKMKLGVNENIMIDNIDELH